MTIKKITYQNRRDFRAVFACSHCGYETEEWGYDDDHFHRDIVPTKKCPKCGKSEQDLGMDYRPMGTKYPEWMTV